MNKAITISTCLIALNYVAYKRAPIRPTTQPGCKAVPCVLTNKSKHVKFWSLALNKSLSFYGIFNKKKIYHSSILSQFDAATIWPARSYRQRRPQRSCHLWTTRKIIPRGPKFLKCGQRNHQQIIKYCSLNENKVFFLFFREF